MDLQYDYQILESLKCSRRDIYKVSHAFSAMCGWWKGEIRTTRESVKARIHLDIIPVFFFLFFLFFFSSFHPLYVTNYTYRCSCRFRLTETKLSSLGLSSICFILVRKIHFTGSVDSFPYLSLFSSFSSASLSSFVQSNSKLQGQRCNKIYEFLSIAVKLS